MSGPGEGEIIVPSRDFAPDHFVGFPIPADFARVIQAAAVKSGLLFADQFLKWAQMGAECSRLHQPKVFKSGRKK